jgi:hypothetical protein
MNWIRAIRDDEEEEEQMFFVEDENEDMVVANYLLQQEASGSRRSRRPDAPSKWPNKRDHGADDAQIHADYFMPNPMYLPLHFHRRYVSLLSFTVIEMLVDKTLSLILCRFHMRPNAFLRIVEVVENMDPYFHFKYDAVGRAGLSALQKCVAAIRILAYGVPADTVDGYVHIGESTTHEALNHFCVAVINVFGEQYLQAPNSDDIARIIAFNEQRGWAGMLGSIDCMHWAWRQCPMAWKGQFTGRGKAPSMILEAVATHDLWIWHAWRMQ